MAKVGEEEDGRALMQPLKASTACTERRKLGK